ncbi:MAG: hypothetical protein J7K46_09360 [Bacteroidales bacterium]|nr:hypothetical protein [Bacteroidales bacterium]
MKISKYSFGIGDRFGRQGKAQLSAILEAEKQGISITPVWNKSYREHSIVGTRPADVRKEADEATKALGWNKPYFVDADHINLNTVDDFIPYSDFFTLDVAEAIGKPSPEDEIQDFIQNNEKYISGIPGLEIPVVLDREYLRRFAGQYLCAVNEAEKLYHYISQHKDPETFVVEVSIDEVDRSQTPADLFFILKALAEKKIPLQTIAPRFSGRFNKGVDYVGDLKRFEREFEQDLLVLDYAKKFFNLPASLKLSIHSGSDKFSIYPLMGRLIRKHDQGIHVKTAGTTWLEELIGLAEAGNEALNLVKKIYTEAYNRQEELTAPYAEVININPADLPLPPDFNSWNSKKIAAALRHVPDNPAFNPNLRQLMHVAYKIAAETDLLYFELLDKYKEIIARQVQENLLNRHILRIFSVA